MTDLHGKVAIVTGANSGIGKETARALARMGATTIVAGRDPGRCGLAVAEMREDTGNPDITFRALDLGSLDSVRTFAADFLRDHARLDILVNNAGVIQRWRSQTPDGFETTLGVNHFGPFLLTMLLLDRLKASAPSRIVNVSSSAHASAKQGFPFDDLTGEQLYTPMGRYGASKLANIYFTRELARRLEGTGVTVNAVHPGFVASGFARDGDMGKLGHVTMKIAKPFARSPVKGAATSIWLATAPEMEGRTGGFYFDRKPGKLSKHATDDEAAGRLWELSEQLTRQTAP